MDDVDAVITALKKKYGPGFSNGVVGILAHKELPDVFGPENFLDWQFRPAVAAFDVAEDMKLICEAGNGFSFTDLGKRCADYVQTKLGISHD